MITLIILIFVIGYSAIAFEHTIKINKAALALITGVLCWMTYILYNPDKEIVNEQLSHHLGEVAGILFFLFGAMTIVELIDAYDGFNIITNKITQTKKRKLLWIVALLAFFLSAVLDNLTTAIVMVSLLRKLIKEKEDRWFFAGIIIIAANAGGVWSPIGDVTTTMLWLGGQISAFKIIPSLFFPSLICLISPLVYLSFRLHGNLEKPDEAEKERTHQIEPKQQVIIFLSGIFILLLVPVFKTYTHLPPYMGILLGWESFG